MRNRPDDYIFGRWLAVIDAGDWLMEAVYRRELEQRGIISRVH